MSEEFKSLPDFPQHMTPVGAFTYLRTYSRFLPEQNRREVWRETVERSTNYNIGLAIQHLEKLGLPVDHDWYATELALLRRNNYNLKQFLSGRTMWVGGAESGVDKKFPLANFNCSFTTIENWNDLSELFYLLLVGTGVGFKATKEMAANLAPVKKTVMVSHKEYTGRPKEYRNDDTQLRINDDRTVGGITVGDSKEGWVDSVKAFFNFLTNPIFKNLKLIEIDYNHIRPAGEELKTFGGTASGHESLKSMFEGFVRVINNKVDASLEPLEEVGDGYVRVRPIHIMDMCNMVGHNVVVGGVRRTSEIALVEGDDWESIFAKFGLNGYWKDEDFDQLAKIIDMLDEHGIPYPERIKSYLVKNYDPKVNGDKPFNFGSGLHHRRMSNNSIAFLDKPDKKYLDLIFEIMQLEGEPAFINLYELARRRLIQMGIQYPTKKMIKAYAKKLGINPCAEILLHSKGVCNLTTINVASFVDENGELDFHGLIEAQRLSVRCGIRMTLVELELEEWNKVQETDRLTGNSLTGWKDAMDAWNQYSEENEAKLLCVLKGVAREEAGVYSKALRIPEPLLTTTIKPEGTLSVVAGSVSNGVHWGYAPFYIRRVRISAHDPLAKAALEHRGWNVYAEVGTGTIYYADGTAYEPYPTEELLATPEAIAQASTLVIEFPVKSPAKTTGDDISAVQQLDNYFMFQNEYTEHNSSNTIRVKNGEWEAVSDKVYENWDNFVGVSFLAHDGGTYKLTPFEAISEEVYESMVKNMQSFDFELLKKYENKGEQDLGEGCDNGVCPTR